MAALLSLKLLLSSYEIRYQKRSSHRKKSSSRLRKQLHSFLDEVNLSEASELFVDFPLGAQSLQFLDSWIESVRRKRKDDALTHLLLCSWLLSRAALAAVQDADVEAPFHALSFGLLEASFLLFPLASFSSTHHAYVVWASGYLMQCNTPLQASRSRRHFQRLRTLALGSIDNVSAVNDRFWCIGVLLLAAASHDDYKLYFGLLRLASKLISVATASGERSRRLSLTSEMKVNDDRWDRQLHHSVSSSKSGPYIVVLREPALAVPNKRGFSNRSRFSDVSRWRLIHTSLFRGPPGLSCGCDMCSFQPAAVSALADLPCWLLAHFAAASRLANDRGLSTLSIEALEQQLKQAKKDAAQMDVTLAKEMVKAFSLK